MFKSKSKSENSTDPSPGSSGDEHAPPQEVQEGEAQAEDAGTSSTTVEPQEKNEQLSAATEQPSAAEQAWGVLTTWKEENLQSGGG